MDNGNNNQNLGCWVILTVITAGIGFALWYFYEPTKPIPNVYHEPRVTLDVKDTTICSMDTLELYASLYAWSKPSHYRFFDNVKWTFVYDSTERIANSKDRWISLLPTPSLRMVVCEIEDDTGNVARDTCVIRVIEVGASRNVATNLLNGFVRSRDSFSANWLKVLGSDSNARLITESTDGYTLSYKPQNSGTYILAVRDELTGCKCYSNTVQFEQ